jgi:hypothetical protein
VALFLQIFAIPFTMPFAFLSDLHILPVSILGSSLGLAIKRDVVWGGFDSDVVFTLSASKLLIHFIILSLVKKTRLSKAEHLLPSDHVRPFRLEKEPGRPWTPYFSRLKYVRKSLYPLLLEG